jgi:hypothetical protein
MTYRRHSNLKAGQFSRTSITGAGNVIKRAGSGGGGEGPQGPAGPAGPAGQDGEDGIDGIDGVSPEPPFFTISAESGDHAAAYISGSHPNWHITLVLQRGEKGDAGDVGPQGPPGTCNCTCECCNPQPPTCPDGYYWDGSNCVPNNTNCGEGYYWNGYECVPIETPPE